MPVHRINATGRGNRDARSPSLGGWLEGRYDSSAEGGQSPTPLVLHLPCLVMTAIA
jgi:hypothetical protein